MSENSEQLSAGSVYFTASTRDNDSTTFDMSREASLNLQVMDDPSPSPTGSQTDRLISSSITPQASEMNVTKSLSHLEASRIRPRMPYDRLAKENKTFDFNSPSAGVPFSRSLPRKRVMLQRFESHASSTLDEEFARELKNSMDTMLQEEPGSPLNSQEALNRADTEVMKRQTILLSRQTENIASVNENETPNLSSKTKNSIFSKVKIDNSSPGDNIEMIFTTPDPISNTESTPLLDQHTGNVENEIEKTVDGLIHFPTSHGRKDANYLIIPPLASPSDLLYVLNKTWKLPPPKIIISLPGNSQLSQSSRFRQMLKENLIRIAATTKAWFLTEGVNKGISAFVGSCLQSHAYKRFAKKEQNQRDWFIGTGFGDYDAPIPIIGMVNPDNIYKGTLFQNPMDSITYSKDTSSLCFPDRNLLDVNHSHFIMLSKSISGQSLDQWSCIEETVSNHLKIGTEPLPIVRIVIDNTLHVIEQVGQSMNKNVATVVISSNELMRKIHSYIFTLTVRDQKKASTKQEFLKSCCGLFKNEAQGEEILTNIGFILDKPNLFTMFDMNMTFGADLSKAIVVALLKSRKSTGKEKLKEALDLVIDWNRVDLAEQNIFTESMVWGDTDLFQHYFAILILNQIDFLELMLERNVIDHASFVKQNLERLYFVANERKHNNNMLFKQLVDRSNIDQHPNVPHSTIKTLKPHNKNSNPPNQTNGPISEDQQKIPIVEIGKLLKYVLKYSFKDVYVENEGMQDIIVDQPIDNLFIWAILTQRWRMAEVLLNNTNSVIFNAVAAKALITGVHHHLKDDQIVSENDLGLLVEVADKFEMTAVGMMEEAYKRDKEQAHLILQQKNRLYDDNNCIEMAVTGRCMTFLSHPCVQSLLDEQWKKPLYHQNKLWKKLLSMIFPFFIYFLISFSDPQPSSPLGYLKFYTSPSIKFITYVIVFILYLTLYSFVVLFQWHPSPNLNPLEWIFIVWSLTYILEEVRQLFAGSGRVMKRARAYFNDRWNQFDTAFALFFIMGTCLRLIPQVPLSYSRHMYAVIGFVLFFRLLQFLVIIKDSGPFVYMVFRMLKNLGSFLILALIFLLAYGVASQTILYPNLPRDDPNSYAFVFGNILFRPYFQVFGEFFLEHIQANAFTNGSSAMFGNSFPEVFVSSNFFVYFFLVIWLILSNILLINIIIAKFNNTFVEIESNAAIYWKYKFFNSVKEFRDKPVLPPPFNVIVIFYRVLKRLYLVCSRYRVDATVRSKDQGDDERKEKEKMLFDFEKRCVLACNFNLEQTNELNLDKRITEVDNRLKNTQHLIVTLTNKVDSLVRGTASFESEQDFLSMQGDTMGSM